ncbi:MAG TPA: hypothetical protein VER77_03315 [Candidatus Dormibacteraeota bacterium]|nr:hypothetical protein [Candidatus Dormibacteraeota bacterium]
MPRTRQPKLATLDVAEEIARRVPGYKGYQEITQRRDDDRRFRMSVAEHLNGEAHRLERIESQQFREDFSDLLEEVDAGARKLEYLAEAVSISMPMKANGPSNDAVDGLGQIDRQIVEELEALHRVVHEMEKAYTHDERFEMNLSELRGIIERIADFIEQRNVALSR